MDGFFHSINWQPSINLYKCCFPALGMSLKFGNEINNHRIDIGNDIKQPLTFWVPIDLGLESSFPFSDGLNGDSKGFASFHFFTSRSSLTLAKTSGVVR